MRTLVVMPTYQEADNVVDVLRRIRKALPDADILVVDDASPDGTADLVEAVGDELEGVRVLRRPAKSGLGSAYRAGFGVALDEGYDVVVEIDADGSHDPADLPALVSAVHHGADLSIGSRYVPGGRIVGWPKRRHALSRWGNRYAAGLLGLAINDGTSGYRAYRAAALRGVQSGHGRADGYAFQVEMAYRLVKQGAKVVEIPVVFVDRERGQSKMSGRIVWEAFALVTGWGLRDLALGRRRRR
jgi:glycosyltransferase involved in cell wall biosynthesis